MNIAPMPLRFDFQTMDIIRFARVELVVSVYTPLCEVIDVIHKWLPIRYSFVLVQISLPSLIVTC